MKEFGYYYPAGAEFDSNAPWNRVEPPEVDFDINITCVVERETQITTDQVYYDEDRWALCDDADTYHAYDYDYASIPEMLSELVKYIDGEMLVLKKSIKDKTASKTERERYRELQRMRESAVGWEISECEIEVL